MSDQDELRKSYNEAMRNVLLARSRVGNQEDYIMNLVSCLVKIFEINTRTLIEIHEEIIKPISSVNPNQPK